jgi:site-specific DNA-methyltransferase (adenine-specific)
MTNATLTASTDAVAAVARRSLPTPYYESGGIRIFHADCRDVLPTLEDESVDTIITDPPYAEGTHAHARSLTGKTTRKLVTFDSITTEAARAVFSELARVAARWVIATMEWRHAVAFEDAPPKGLRFVRFGIWTKPAYTPQVSGDRPAQGWEAVAIMHRDARRRMRWHGGGRSAVWHHMPEKPAIYPTGKPLPLVRDFFADFAEPGGLVFDPFCGSGTTLVVAAERGHPAIGCDISEAACELAAKRVDAVVKQGTMFRGAA